MEDQALARVHRLGQKKQVHVRRLVAAETIEERILALQEGKRSLAASALTRGAVAAGALERLSEAELAALFA